MTGWWYVRLRIRWPEKKEPSWHIDPLLAHRIYAPVLDKYKDKIAIWRFHRRAARDAEGHQFSLTFYSSAQTALHVFRTIRANTLLKRMKRSGYIIQDLYDSTAQNKAPEVAHTSDGHWSTPVRKSWPYFIMGVCHMWLALIEDFSSTHSGGKNVSSLPRLITLYRHVNTSINKAWREEGSHSMLHHLNAVFGYEPVYVREIHQRRF